jgi:putative ABC transport system permease protein
MFSNFLKITLRKLKRNKVTSAINIMGLAIGMASAMLILLWIHSEISTDRFHTKVDRLYWMYERNKINGEVVAVSQTPTILAGSLKHDFPEVEAVSRINNVTFLISAGEKHLNSRGAFVDSSCLAMFTFPLAEGNAATAMNNPSGIVLTKNLAKRLFGDQDAYGKTVRIDSNANFTVTGVLADMPGNSSFDFEYLLPWSFVDRLGWTDKNWTNNFSYTYVLLKPGSSQAAFDAKVKDLIIDHTKGASYVSTAQLFTQPLGRAYLYADAVNGRLVSGRIDMVRLFSIIAAFTLLIACVNFMNLSTARSERYAKEVGIRKVSGAQRKGLIAQFIGESIFLSLLAFLIAVLIVQLSLPGFNQLIGRLSPLTINYADPAFWLVACGFVLITGIVAGSYPAIYLSSFKSVSVLKGTFSKAGAQITPRKVLVVLQFSFAILLIISTIIVKNQIDFVRARDLGYNKSNLVFTFAVGDADKHYPLIREELVKSGAALAVSRNGSPITERWNSGSGYRWEGSNPSDNRTEFVTLGSDADLSKTVGITLLQGRDIDVYRYPTDTAAMLLNESAVRVMRLKNPIGEIIRRGNNQLWHVVGVVKDFILESPFESRINPMIIKGPGDYFQVIHFKLNPANPVSVDMVKAEAIFKKYNPQYPFEYYFADETFARRFREVSRTGQLSMLFAGLTIFISCLGLFGLATYMAENRTKEIGVRKVLGATVPGIAILLSKDFLKLVVISFVIASPAAWYLMNAWLQDYTYRIDIAWWVFAFAGLLSVLIALITISYQAVRAAMANPVKSLRTQ